MTTLDDIVPSWLSLPEVADALGVELRAVRGMLTERRLVAVRRGPNRALSVPDDFLLRDGAPDGDGSPEVLPALRGTIIQLADSGYDEEGTVRWLFTENAELDAAPIAALRGGRIHAVRRAAQVLAF